MEEPGRYSQKLQWLDSRHEKLTYLFAQAFGNCVGEAYRIAAKKTLIPPDPIEFAWSEAEKAIAKLEQELSDRHML
jgi:hypothetical protein